MGIVVVEQFKLLQPLFSTDLKQALISELVGNLLRGFHISAFHQYLHGSRIRNDAVTGLPDTSYRMRVSEGKRRSEVPAPATGSCICR